jgi:hypothetical protein
MRRVASVLILGVWLAAPHPVWARQSAVPSAGPPVSTDYRFSSSAGLLFFYVRPDRAADFETVLARLGTVLDVSPDPVRKQQAASFRVFKSLEVTRDAAIYVFAFDPVVAGADYDPIKILGEAAPTEVQALYERLKAAIIRVERMGLGRIR